MSQQKIIKMSQRKKPGSQDMPFFFADVKPQSSYEHD